MGKYRALHPNVEATFFIDQAKVQLGKLEVIVPAGHYLLVFSGGVGVLSQEDFEMLYGAVEGPVVRSYS